MKRYEIETFLSYDDAKAAYPGMWHYQDYGHKGYKTVGVAVSQAKRVGRQAGWEADTVFVVWKSEILGSWFFSVG